MYVDIFDAMHVYLFINDLLVKCPAKQWIFFSNHLFWCSRIQVYCCCSLRLVCFSGWWISRHLLPGSAPYFGFFCAWMISYLAWIIISSHLPGSLQHYHLVLITAPRELSVL